MLVQGTCRQRTGAAASYSACTCQCPQRAPQQRQLRWHLRLVCTHACLHAAHCCQPTLLEDKGSASLALAGAVVCAALQGGLKNAVAVPCSKQSTQAEA